MTSKFLILATAEANNVPSAVTSEPLTAQEQSTAVPDRPPIDPNSAARQQARRPLGPSYWIFLVLMFVVMYVILFRGPRKKQQQHRQMVQSLSKNDKVRTIGGIIGTVVEIKGDEIVLKVDESNNTKIRVSSAAIGKNLSKDNK